MMTSEQDVDYAKVYQELEDGFIISAE